MRPTFYHDSRKNEWSLFDLWIPNANHSQKTHYTEKNIKTNPSIRILWSQESACWIESWGLIVKIRQQKNFKKS